ncbi:hypothetical protein IVA87_29445 [Bradyrhizobium sp. 147]|jgi:NTE family protein|uniref:hypothetical protein n=1 Tax=unclassified Bradyrhizobium TaxID=2631580 RepID=UPI001FFB23A6|nr:MULTISPECIES: hypothetical protein [unclassified Bradyrhizobium]MCK1542708.1 hypothetical protein [Bradyrhizobium sp. 179]MCK1621987.1 hypothetical protein [Bradyrhizobium sp. 160]MCK1683414.1 hypothetical protein [Bradyrhizobium sp. 147]
MDHILASCGFLPEFAPVQIAGRWLGDEAAAERKSDLTYGNQTFQRLGHALEARQLRAELQDLVCDDLVDLQGYRQGREEAGPEKSFDLSEAVAQRWRAGLLDMQYAASVAPIRNGICTVRRR